MQMISRNIRENREGFVFGIVMWFLSFCTFFQIFESTLPWLSFLRPVLEPLKIILMGFFALCAVPILWLAAMIRPDLFTPPSDAGFKEPPQIAIILLLLSFVICIVLTLILWTAAGIFVQKMARKTRAFTKKK